LRADRPSFTIDTKLVNPPVNEMASCEQYGPSDVPMDSEITNLKRTARRNTHMADVIVKAAVKDATDDLHVSTDFYDALDAAVHDLLDDAARRAEQNNRTYGNSAT
jgi:hypothetical protein